MAKLTDIMQDRKFSRGGRGRRRYTMVDMAIVKHDAAVKNARIKRGEEERGVLDYVAECGCGVEGCFIHGTVKPAVDPT